MDGDPKSEVATGLKANAYTNLKFWIEAEHFRTERHRFGDISDAQNYDFNLYRPNRTKWADAILNRYLSSRSSNKVQLSSADAEIARCCRRVL